MSICMTLRRVLWMFVLCGVVASACQAIDFTFDGGSKQGWQRRGWYDGGGLDPVSGYFTDQPASAAFGSLILGFGEGGFAPASPNGYSFLHQDFDSPDLGTQADWQSAGTLSYDVLGNLNTAGGAPATWVQAVLKVRKPDSSVSYFTDGLFHEIPTRDQPGYGVWQTHTVDIDALGIPSGSTLMNLNMRFFFEPRAFYSNLLYLDNVRPGLAELSGDFSGDNFVDGGDLSLLLGFWGAAASPIPPGWNGAPPIGSLVDADELSALLGTWGQGTPPMDDGRSARVPEPASLTVLLATAIGGMMYRRLQHDTDHERRMLI